MTSSRRWVCRLLRFVAWTAGALVAVMVVAQILLSPAVCASFVEKYYPRYIDGKLEAERVYVSLFRHFPAVTANIDKLAITYPASRFDSSAVDRVDTLASFGRFTAAVNVLSLLRGTINVKKLELVRPHAFICRYADSTTNLSILKLATEEQEEVKDTSVTVLPRILIRRVRLGDRARIVCVDEPRNTRALLFLKDFSVNGRLDSEDPLASRFRMELDTLVVTGRTAKDTLLFDLDHFYVNNRAGGMKLDAEARAYAATRSFGRIKVPFSLKGKVKVENPDSLWKISCEGLDVDLATICAVADAEVAIGDRIDINGNVDIKGLDFQTLLDDYVVHFYPDAAKIHTDAKMTASAQVDGWYDPASGELPSFRIKADLDPCRIRHDEFDIVPAVELHASSSAPQGGPVDLEVSKFALNASGIHLLASGGGHDILNGKGTAFLDAGLKASLDSLDRYLSEAIGLNMKGGLDAEASGSIPLSGVSVYNLKNTDLKANATLRDVFVSTLNDSLSLSVNNLGLKVALMEDRFKISNRKDAKTLGAMLTLDSVSFKYCDSLDVAANGINLLAQTSPMMNTTASGEKYNPLSVSLSLGKVSVHGGDSLSLRLSDSRNSASVVPSAEDRDLPRIRLSSGNKRLSARSGPHRLILSGLNFTADTRMNKSRKGRQSGANVKHTEEADSSFNLSVIRNYLRRWTLKGGLDLDRLILATPAFPLRTSASKFRGSFDNESIHLDSLRLSAGASRLAVDGSMSNFRKALNKTGPLRMTLNLNTDTLAISEFLNAYAMGQKNMKTDLSYLAEADDAQYEDMVAAQVDTVSDITSLIEVPSGVDATIRLRGRGVSLFDLDISSLAANLAIRNRCLQLGGVEALTPVGNIYADAFYSTETRKDVYAGFDLNLENISAGEAIDLIPQIDTLMPLLKSFDGKLNCNVAATTQLDTNMNLIMPSLEGVVRITGEDLHFNDNREVTKIARMLWIKNPERATIDSMTVEGILRDNTFEVFPFLIKMSNWTVAVAGVQNMDRSFSYHVSLAKTPFLIKLGANITGPDFDHMEFKLGKAKYRSTEVPSFSKEIDASRTNLVQSIRNVFRRGVRQAVLDNRSQRKNFQSARDRMGYGRSASLEKLEELPGSDREKLDSLNTAPTGSDAPAVPEDPVNLK